LDLWELKVIKYCVKWLRYSNKYIYIDLRDLSIHFRDGAVISGTIDDNDDPDNIKVLTSGSLTDITSQIKETID
jgi:hypothetical protein